MRKLIFLFILIFSLSIGVHNTWGQTTIHSNSCSSATAEWTYTNGGTSLAIQQSNYWLLDDVGDIIISQPFDISPYESLSLTFEVATYGSGTNHSCMVEYSTDNGVTWSSSNFTSATPTSSTYISAGTWNLGTINSTQFKFKWTSPSGGAKGVRMRNILFQGISAPVPTIATVGTLSSFSTSPGSPSAEQTYTVSGSGLTNDIVITPPSTNFEISQTSGSGFTNSPITLTQTGGTVGTTTIYVRFNPSSAGTFTDTIFNSSIGATTQRITVSGVSSSAYSFPLVEDFSYTVGDSLGANGWACHSGSASTNIMVVSPGLTYTNYSGSNIGNAVKLIGSGCDNNKIFGNRNSGSIYCSFLVNVESAKTGGDYFIHFGTNSWSQNFYARVFVKSDASNNIYFGIMKNSGGSATVAYSSTAYSLNTTYLLVFKYTFNASSNDDVVSLFVITGSIPSIEPTPDVTHSDAGQNDATGIGGIALRQGGSSAPTLTIDGIRVGTSWSDVPLPISLNSFTSSVVGNNVTLNWTTATETNNSHFEIERQSGSVWQKIGSVAGSGTTNTEKYYSYTDRNLNSGTYGYRLKQLDYNGNFQYYNLSSSVIVGTPKTFSITSYPNPFNPIATIKYNLPQDADVKITVFNALGQRITTLVNEYKTAGFYSVQLDGSALASGVYFYRITAGNYDAVKKIMLIK